MRVFQISFRSLSRHTHTALNSRRTYTWRTYTWRTYTWRTSSLRRDRSAGMALIVPVAAPCGCARYIVFIVFGGDCAIVPVAAPAILSFSMCVSLCVFYVCTMCLPQREHVLFGVVKWKLDVQLYWLILPTCLCIWPTNLETVHHFGDAEPYSFIFIHIHSYSFIFIQATRPR